MATEGKSAVCRRPSSKKKRLRRVLQEVRNPCALFRGKDMSSGVDALQNPERIVVSCVGGGTRRSVCYGIGDDILRV